MLNETASSASDQPLVRSSVPEARGPEESQNDEVRQLVATVMAIASQSPETDEGSLEFEALMMTPGSRWVGSFTGQLLLPSDEAYQKLDELLVPLDQLALFRQKGPLQVIHVLSGRPAPAPRNPWINLALFIATFLTVLMTGAEMGISEIAARDNLTRPQIEQMVINLPSNLYLGLPFALSLMLILGAHELGHYFAARYHKVSVTLPYFIPAPLVGFLGTFGGFIQLRSPMRSRRVLFDIGAAGPLIGLLFAIPILIIGLSTSPIKPISGGTIEGNSLFYALIKTLIFGHFLPDGIRDVYLNQMAMAGWSGLFVSALNLLPIGQLDGGHVLYSLIGERARRIYWPALAAIVVLAVLSSGIMWLLWFFMLLFLGRVYAVPLDNITPLDTRRKFLGVLTLVLFVVLFIPQPFTITEVEGVVPPANSAMIMPMFGALAVLMYQRLKR